jgi:hypothetical protein
MQILLIFSAVALLSASLLSQTPQVRFRGIIASFDGTTLVVQTPDGKTTSVGVPADVRIKAPTVSCTPRKCTSFPKLWAAPAKDTALWARIRTAR